MDSAIIYKLAIIFDFFKNRKSLLLSKNNHSKGPKNLLMWESNPWHLYFTSMNPNVPGSIPMSRGFFGPNK